MSTRTHIVIVGAGGLGSPLLYALGHDYRFVNVPIRLLDPDRVELSNLHRQIFFRTEDIGQPKAELLAGWMTREFDLAVEAVVEPLSASNITEHLASAQLVIDGTDSTATKFMVDRFCEAEQLPRIIGGVAGWEGHVFATTPGQGCYHCLFETNVIGNDAPSCGQDGVLGPFAGLVGVRMAACAAEILRGEAASRAVIEKISATPPYHRRIFMKQRATCENCSVRPHSSPNLNA